MEIGVCRPRDPRRTPLFKLLESHFDSVKRAWEERFEASYGFWQGCWDTAVARYLDCGIWDHGFARVRCDACRYEMLVPFSCKQRELCPSCAAKRGTELAAFLSEHVLQDVPPHAQWVFTIPKMLRPLFFRRRELRGVLARLAWQTVREMMAAAVEEPDLRPGMVSVIQTFGDRLNPHPHVHALVSRGGWSRDDRFVFISDVDPLAAQVLFRHKVFTFLLREELITRERVELLCSWRHSGFCNPHMSRPERVPRVGYRCCTRPAGVSPATVGTPGAPCSRLRATSEMAASERSVESRLRGHSSLWSGSKAAGPT